jgi:hypothetical protein
MREDELPDIRPLRPGSFVARTPLWSGPDLLAFDAREPGDFDWIEEMMLTHGCYEHEGVWDLALGFDKQAMAEIMAAFRPARTLEIGCASGTVLHYLAGLGLPCEGIEISRLAVERAIPDVRDWIHEAASTTRCRVPRRRSASWPGHCRRAVISSRAIAFSRKACIGWKEGPRARSAGVDGVR